MREAAGDARETQGLVSSRSTCYTLNTCHCLGDLAPGHNNNNNNNHNNTTNNTNTNTNSNNKPGATAYRTAGSLSSGAGCISKGRILRVSLFRSGAVMKALSYDGWPCSAL